MNLENRYFKKDNEYFYVKNVINIHNEHKKCIMCAYVYLPTSKENIHKLETCHITGFIVTESWTPDIANWKEILQIDFIKASEEANKLEGTLKDVFV